MPHAAVKDAATWQLLGLEVFCALDLFLRRVACLGLAAYLTARAMPHNCTKLATTNKKCSHLSFSFEAELWAKSQKPIK